MVPFIAIIIDALAAIIYLICNAIGKKKYKSMFGDIANEVCCALNNYHELFKPNRLIQDVDLEQFLTQYRDLFNKITFLESHKRFEQSLFDEYKITDLQQAVKCFQEYKEKSNTIYFAISDIQQQAQDISSRFKRLMLPNQYFTFSEMQGFKESIEHHIESAKLLHSKYQQYISDNTTKEVIDMIVNIEDNRTKHNKEFVDAELSKNKEYFDTVLGNYPLDPQQRDSIVKLEDNTLVIASAGSGKTSTIVGKIKYLVEKQKVDPSKILLLTYTKKAAMELSERVKVDGLLSGTFHGLAYKIIAETTGQAPSVCNADVTLNVFRKLLSENNDFLQAINSYILNYQSLMKLEHEYDDAFAYYEDRKKYGIQSLFSDIDGKLIFTKSEEEKRICTILTKWGVKFRYEQDYQFDTKTPERRQYKPDFSIYFNDCNGKSNRIYLEHFAIDADGCVPMWFGDGCKGGWGAANKKYNDGISWKRNLHRSNGTILIETTSAQFHDGTIESVLKQALTRHGVQIVERTDSELYDILVSRNRQLEKTVFTLITSFVTLMKANEKSIDELINSLNVEDGKVEPTVNIRNRYILNNIIKPYYSLYQSELKSNYTLDFTDLVIQATKICRMGMWKSYEHILVDEFQDISVDRYKLLQALRGDETKLFCVGDDWQSIFRFAGSDMSLFYEFEKAFGYTEVCKIETTYRFNQPIIDMSSSFILKNPEQKHKSVKPATSSKTRTYLNFYKYNSDYEDDVLRKVETIVRSIPNDETILLLGRYNYDAVSVGFKGKVGNGDLRIKVHIAGRDIVFMSVHSAKGLESDHVILLNCNHGAHGFPSLIEDDPILDFVLSKSESYPFAEERRLFYVAITRARKQVHVLYDSRKPSIFISEFLLKLDVGCYMCPKCLEGMIKPIKGGVLNNGTCYQTFVCTNRESGCDFIETKYGDLTSPGIKITAQMTPQDIEKIREQRRTLRKQLSEAH